MIHIIHFSKMMEDSLMKTPTLYDLLTQLVEYNTFNIGVDGSSPSQITNN